jgi:hypothetical protein
MYDIEMSLNGRSTPSPGHRQIESTSAEKHFITHKNTSPFYEKHIENSSSSPSQTSELLIDRLNLPSTFPPLHSSADIFFRRYFR